MLRASILAFALLLSTVANGQLFRAYLSHDGNDANACTLASPCRLMPAALAAVASGGEIWMLDSGNYNTATVTIGKSVSILAVPGAVGSLVAAGGPAVSISAGGLVVGLRNLVIVPLPGGGGSHGVDMTGDSSLTIENSLLANLPAYGVRVLGTGRVKISDSTFRNNASYAVRLFDGATADIVSTKFFGNLAGVYVTTATATSTTASVSDSEIVDNSYGVYAQTAVGGLARVFLTRSTIRGANYAMVAFNNTGGGVATVAVSNSMIVDNNYAWVQDGTGTTIRTFQNNAMSDNSTSTGLLTNTPSL